MVLAGQTAVRAPLETLCHVHVRCRKLEFYGDVSASFKLCAHRYSQSIYPERLIRESSAKNLLMC